MTGFDWRPRTRIVFGEGNLGRLGELAAGLGGRRALIVTDPGIVAAGHIARARAILEAAGLLVAIFDAVRENPDTDDVAACLAAVQEHRSDLLIGLGGGSSIDTAKGANFLLTNGGALYDYWKAGNPDARAPRAPLLPLIAVPTTAGTGSEVQSHALLADAATHAKMAIGDPAATPAIALLDPELTLSCPRAVTAVTGIDALAHAVESWVTTRRNPVSALFSREAFSLLLPNFKRVLAAPGDRAARGAMLLGASYAGLAIEASMLGAAHAAANPLTAHFGVVHGLAVATMLPQVVRFNAQDDVTRQHYDALMPVDQLIVALEGAVAALEMPAPAVPVDAIPTLAAEADRQWTARFNPRPISAADFETLYRNAL